MLIYYHLSRTTNAMLERMSCEKMKLCYLLNPAASEEDMNTTLLLFQSETKENHKSVKQKHIKLCRGPPKTNRGYTYHCPRRSVRLWKRHIHGTCSNAANTATATIPPQTWVNPKKFW